MFSPQALFSFGFDGESRIGRNLESAVVIRQTMEPDVLPKLQAGEVVIHHESVALLDSLRGKRGQALLHKKHGCALLAKFLLDCEVTQNAAPTVMATKECSDEVAIGKSDEA